jgi:glycosyltransferase involved in cell wall biosynthesis
MMAACRSLALDLNAPVEFLGERTDVADQLAQASGVCLFSGFEGVPFAVQEAMWVGRPVVLSPLPSLRWFAAGAASYADDAEAAAEAMVQLCDRDIALERGESAAARVRALLSPDAPFPQLMRDYSERSAITDR